MKIVYFTHSLESCWNHGNAHFLRGVLRELQALGHAVDAFEPADAWSRENLLRDEGEAGLEPFRRHYPELRSHRYGPDFDPEEAVDEADCVIVHEWNAPGLVAALGRLRAQGARFTLLFHDTHHRAVSDPDSIATLDLSGYDGILAFGEALAAVYRRLGWGSRVFVWHEAADTRLFKPPGSFAPDPVQSLLAGDARNPSPLAGEGGAKRRMRGRANSVASRPGSITTVIDESAPREGFVFIGNWGDDERTEELETFLFEPVRRSGAALDVYGVRWPDEAVERLAEDGVAHHGYLPNPYAPAVFARHAATVHVPRRWYASILPGIPTIRVFEALACGIPLLSAPWEDAEHLFRPGLDHLVAKDGAAMARHMRSLMHEPGLAASLAAHGLETVLARHTCAHRARELLTTLEAIRSPSAQEVPA